MLKARKEDDGQIKIYGALPSKFRGVTGNYAGGFHLASGEVLEREGFFDVVTPEYNRVMETLGEIYLDEANKVYTYNVLPRTDLPTLEEAKINKIEELKRNAREKFSETDWYYIRELRTKEMGEIKEVPSEIVQQNNELYDLVDVKEQEINALTDLEAVLTFNTSFAEAAPAEIEKPKEEIPLSASVSPSASASEPIPTPEDSLPSEETLPAAETPASAEGSGEAMPVSASEPIPTPEDSLPSEETPPATETPASAEGSGEAMPVSASEPIPTSETPDSTPSTNSGQASSPQATEEIPVIEEPVVEEPVVETPVIETPTPEVSTEVVARASTKKLKNILAKASTKKSSKKSKKTLAKKSGKKSKRA